eukprot:10716851-Alexandrium_andersonii.AAC.1
MSPTVVPAGSLAPRCYEQPCLANPAVLLARCVPDYRKPESSWPHRAALLKSDPAVGFRMPHLFDADCPCA